jgi:ferrous iron transport protein A
MTFNIDTLFKMPESALSLVGTKRRVTIERIELEGEAAAWLAAVGLHDGEELVVLRRAAFGGPLHVRTSSGGEFAVAREVAALIRVRTSSVMPELVLGRHARSVPAPGAAVGEGR